MSLNRINWTQPLSRSGCRWNACIFALLCEAAVIPVLHYSWVSKVIDSHRQQGPGGLTDMGWINLKWWGEDSRWLLVSVVFYWLLSLGVAKLRTPLALILIAAFLLKVIGLYVWYSGMMGPEF
jgi:hypothetical protein